MGIIFSAKCTSSKRLDGKTVVVTGANTGIGKETVIDLFERGAKVYLACRDQSKAEAAVKDVQKKCGTKLGLGKLETITLDLSSLTSVRACANQLLQKKEKIDILINNAGIMMTPFSRTEDGFELQFGTNHLGHFAFTLLLLPLLCHSSPSRIINVSSVVHTYYTGLDFDDLNWEKRKYHIIRAYHQSKLANILFTKELAKKFKEHKITGINTYAVHPGVIRTELFRHYGSHFPGISWLWTSVLALFFKTPKQGAQTQIYCAVSDECADESGLYYAECKVKKSNPDSNNAEYASKMWNMSLKYVGLKEEDIFKFKKD